MKDEQPLLFWLVMKILF